MNQATKKVQLSTTSNLPKLCNSNKNPHEPTMKTQHTYILFICCGILFSALTYVHIFPELAENTVLYF